MSNPQPPVNNLITFTPGSIVQSAQVNQDFSDLVNLQGNTVGSSLQQVLSQALNGYVQSGGVLTTASGLTVNMSAAYLVTSGILYYMPAQAFTVQANKDTYIDFNPGNITYTATPVANNAASPGLSSPNATRMGKVISGASSVSSNVQTGVDSNFLPFRPLSSIPFGLIAQLFGNQVQSFANSGSAGGTFYYINLGGIKLLWGLTGLIAINAATVNVNIAMPSGFFSTVQAGLATAGQNFSGDTRQLASFNPLSASGNTVLVCFNSTEQTTTSSAYFVLIIGT